MVIGEKYQPYVMTDLKMWWFSTPCVLDLVKSNCQCYYHHTIYEYITYVNTRAQILLYAFSSQFPYWYCCMTTVCNNHASSNSIYCISDMHNTCTLHNARDIQRQLESNEHFLYLSQSVFGSFLCNVCASLVDYSVGYKLLNNCSQNVYKCPFFWNYLSGNLSITF